MMSHFKIKREYLFYLVVILFWFGQYVYAPFLSPYMRTIGISATVIGVIAGMYGVSQLVVRIPLSIADWKSGSHKLIIIAGLICVVISCIIPIFTDSWIAFFTTRLLAGIAASSWISYSAHMIEGAGGKANSKMGNLIAAQTTGQCISQVVGALVYDHTNIRTLFIIGALSAAFALVVLAFTPISGQKIVKTPNGDVDSRHREKRELDKDSFISVIKNKHLWLCSLIMAAFQLLAFATNNSFAGVFAQDYLAATAFQLGLIFLIPSFVSILVSMIFGKIGKKALPERALLVFAFIIMVAYCILSFLSTNMIQFLAVQALCGISAAIIKVVLFANAGRELSADKQILSMGIFQSIYSLGIMFGPIIFGIAFDKSGEDYTFTYILLAVIALIGAIVSFLMYKNSRKDNIKNL